MHRGPFFRGHSVVIWPTQYVTNVSLHKSSVCNGSQCAVRPNTRSHCTLSFHTLTCTMNTRHIQQMHTLTFFSMSRNLPFVSDCTAFSLRRCDGPASASLPSSSDCCLWTALNNWTTPLQTDITTNITLSTIYPVSLAPSLIFLLQPFQTNNNNKWSK